MKEKIISLMEKTLSAYPDSHILSYFDDVKREGLTEHGFPRLTADIGILISHGRRTDLMSLFLEMMEFCCKNIPKVKAANDFSVREICSCISALEESDTVPVSDISRWKSYLSEIDPFSCYNQYAVSPTDKVKNWGLFTAVSEYFRMKMGLGGSEEFIDIQLASQLQWLDENGMYMDAQGDKHHPIVYDLAPRGLFALLLKAGYRGRYYDEIDSALRRSGILTLKMQSPNGEVAFGGRSNQFIHNEPWMIGIYAYEAERYIREGNLSLASEFGAAIVRAIGITEEHLNAEPIYHIKNRFPTETRYGCEKYAYFDKYMITVASNLYSAYLLWNDAIPVPDVPDVEPSVALTSEHFHKLFLKAGGYGIEFDLDGDPHYDASGLGRVHKAGAPSAICLSVPCPCSPKYTVNIENPVSLSLCPGILVDGEWIFATDLQYKVMDTSCDEHSASCSLYTRFASGEEMISKYTVNRDGVKIEVSGACDVAFMLPAFHFDGESYTELTESDGRLEIKFKNRICRYTVSGEIHSANSLAANRNGLYKVYYATGKDKLDVMIDII